MTPRTRADALERVTRHAAAIGSDLGVSCLLPPGTPAQRARVALDQAWVALHRWGYRDTDPAYRSVWQRLAVLEEDFTRATAPEPEPVRQDRKAVAADGGVS